MHCWSRPALASRSELRRSRRPECSQSLPDMASLKIPGTRSRRALRKQPLEHLAWRDLRQTSRKCAATTVENRADSLAFGGMLQCRQPGVTDCKQRLAQLENDRLEKNRRSNLRARHTMQHGGREDGLFAELKRLPLPERTDLVEVRKSHRPHCL